MITRVRTVDGHRHARLVAGSGEGLVNGRDQDTRRASRPSHTTPRGRPGSLASFDYIAERVGVRLRELRRDAELSQAEIARRTGIHRPIVGRIERGVHVASLDTVRRYAAALDLDVATVLVCLDEAWVAADVRGEP